MSYVNQEQYNEQRNLRDMIDGELNRIAVTDELEEIDKMVNCLQHSILRYAQKHRNRINPHKWSYKKEDVSNYHIEL